MKTCDSKGRLHRSHALLSVMLWAVLWHVGVSTAYALTVTTNTVTLDVVADTGIRTTSPTINVNGTQVIVGNTANGSGERLYGLVRFDTSTINIPIGGSVQVTGVILNTVNDTAGQNSPTIQVYDYAYDFGETTATWNNPAGDSSDATAGGTTGLLLSSSAVNSAAGASNSFGSSANFVSIVEGAINGDDTVNLLLKRNTFSDANNFTRFLGDEGGVGFQLDVTYVLTAPDDSDVVWTGEETTNITASSAWASATINSNLQACVLVWAGTANVPDPNPGTTNDWPYSLNVGSTNGTVTAQMAGLAADTNYVWRYYGVNATTNGWSDATPFISGLSSAQAPAFTSSSGLRSSNIELGWQDNAANETGYILQRSTTLGSGYATIATLSSNTTSYTDTGLDVATTYYYQMAATNASNGTSTDFADCRTSAATLDFSVAGYAMQITFTNFSGHGTLTNFPALVKLTTGNTDSYTGFMDTTNGWDLRFGTSQTGSTELPYEIESFDTNGTSYVWVKVPELTHNSSIWALWGDADYNIQESYTTNGTVWSEGYAGVWHMDSTDPTDSTATADNGSGTGNVDGSGIIGGGQVFDGNNDYVQVSSTLPELDLTTEATFAFWANHSDTDADQDVIASGNHGSGIPYLIWRDNASPDSYAFLFNDSSANYSGAFFTTGVADPGVSEWVYVVITFEAGSATGVKAYFDGDKYSTDFDVSGLSNIAAADDLLFGNDDDQSGDTDGTLDEIRISTVARSADWIWACYKNQGPDHTQFVEYGSVLRPSRGTVFRFR